MKFLLTVFLVLATLGSTCLALEIKNQKVTTSGSTIVIAYDLFGKPGERSANVKVSIVIDGERYKPGSININGDYGSNTPVGKNKTITWNLLSDMPAGYTGTIMVEMDADVEANNDPFNLQGTKSKAKPPVISDFSVADPKSKLVWLRSPLSIRPVSSLDAAVSVIGIMNQRKYAGFNDWRLPKKAEYEALLKMLENYGYKTGQSATPYLAKVGFDIDSDSRFWTIDKSSLELVGRSVSTYASGQYGGSASGQYSAADSARISGSASMMRTTGSRSDSRGARISTGSISGSGSMNMSRSGSISASQGSSMRASSNSMVTAEGLYDGLDSLFIDTRDGYFYKHNGADKAYVFAVRGDASTEIFRVSIPVEVAINP